MTPRGPVGRGFGTLLLGAAAGAVWLGVGGRIAMWLFAVITPRTPVVTLPGTLFVVLTGAIAGEIGGLVLLLAGRFLPAGGWRRGLAFAALCYGIAIPGFRPPTLLVFSLFAPWFQAYGVALARLEGRLRPTSPLQYGSSSGSRPT